MPPRPHGSVPTILSFAVAAAFASAALGNPMGPSVAAGIATFQSAGGQLTVTNTPGTIINWQSFSIGAGEATRFQQQSAASAVLNRVVGGDPSSILGSLSSNGRMFLINPHGIVFGRNAIIDTAGFIASTLNITDQDFLAGRLRFEGGGHGLLRNEGAIRADGDIFLVGPQIESAGLLRSASGSVLLAAGKSLTITSPDAQGVQFALQAPTDSALNIGAIEAGSAVGMFASTLRHSGEIRAVSASLDQAGRVTLSASKEAIVDAGATIVAGNAQGRGGSVLVWSDQDTRVHGAIRAPGGFVETSGKRHLDVSGIRLHAPGGTWLLDPLNIEVVAGNGLVNNGGATGFAPAGGSSQIGADLITAQLDAGTSVVLNTNVAGPDAGNITVNSPIVKTVNNAAGLSLIADNDINVNANIDLGAGFANANFNAAGNFSIANATISARNINVTAASVQRTGPQTNDFVYSRAGAGGFHNGTFRLTATTGGVGSASNPIRFNDDFGYHDWGVTTSAAGAAGNVYMAYTGTGAADVSLGAVTTHAGSSQLISIANVRATNGNINLVSNIFDNDNWLINANGGFSIQYGNKLTANSINLAASGQIGYFNFFPNTVVPLVFDTSTANGNISVTAGSFPGNLSGGAEHGLGVRPGTGTVIATATQSGGGPAIGVRLKHFGGDLLTSRYVLSIPNGGANNEVRLRTDDGHIIFDSSAGFNANLNDKNWEEVRAGGAGKDVRFSGGTLTGNRVNLFAGGNIDNLAPGVDSWREVCANANCSWIMEAGGGIGLTNPIRAQADWVGNLQTSGTGAAGDIRVAWSGAPRISSWATDAGSAQTHALTGSTLLFSQGSSFPGAGYVLSNDVIGINLTGDLQWANNGSTHSAASLTINAGGNIMREAGHGGSNYLFRTTGPMSVTAGGSLGAAGAYALIPAAGTLTVSAGTNLFLDAGANPLTLTALTTGPAAGTVGLRTTAANDLSLGGTTNINDTLVLNIGGNVLFPTAASFTTSGGLTLNSPAQVAAGASVTLTGGTSAANAGFSNAGTVNLNGGSLNLAGGYTDAGGSLLLAGGGTVTAPAAGLTLNTGTLGGVGTVTGNLTHNGVLNVGASPGTMTINGNLALGAGSTLNVELGGTTQGVNYDLLQVTGTANLAGTLNVSMFGGFTGTAGNVFDVIAYASRTGDFTNVNFPAGFSMNAAPGATAYQLALLAPPAPPPAAVAASSSPLNDAAVRISADQARQLRDRFAASVEATRQPAQDDARETLECRP